MSKRGDFWSDTIWRVAQIVEHNQQSVLFVIEVLHAGLRPCVYKSHRQAVLIFVYRALSKHNEQAVDKGRTPVMRPYCI
jgi:hypothetical protein